MPNELGAIPEWPFARLMKKAADAGMKSPLVIEVLDADGVQIYEEVQYHTDVPMQQKINRKGPPVGTQLKYPLTYKARAKDKQDVKVVAEGSSPLTPAQPTCEKCGKPTNQSFGSPPNLHYFCPEHKADLFQEVTGRRPREES